MQANKLRARMVEQGYTQRSLAKEINMSENSLGLKLSGRTQFTLAEANRICGVLCITDAMDKADIFLP